MLSNQYFIHWLLHEWQNTYSFKVTILALRKTTSYLTMTEDVLNSSSQGTSSRGAQSQCTVNRQMVKSNGAHTGWKRRVWRDQNTHSKIRMSRNQERQETQSCRLAWVSPRSAGLKIKILFQNSCFIFPPYPQLSSTGQQKQNIYWNTAIGSSKDKSAIVKIDTSVLIKKWIALESLTL